MAEEQKDLLSDDVQADPSAATVTAGEGNEIVVTPQSIDGSQTVNYGSQTNGDGVTNGNGQSDSSEKPPVVTGGDGVTNGNVATDGNNNETGGEETDGDGVNNGNVVTGGNGNEVNNNKTDGGEDEEVDLYEEGTRGLNSQIDTLDKWMASAKAPETKEEREKRERKERSRRVISAVSDGLSALSNLFFTTKYAPDMYEPKNSMTAATNAQIEKARADREKNDEAYYNFALKRGQLEHERAKTVREIEAEQEKRKMAREEAARKAEEHKWKADLQPDIKREHTNRADKEGHLSKKAENDALTAGYNAKTAKAKSDYAPLQEQATLNKTNAQTGQAVAAANSYNASAENSHASAQEHRAKTNKIIQGSGSGGHDEVTITETYDKNGNKKSTQVVRKNNGKGVKGKNSGKTMPGVKQQTKK